MGANLLTELSSVIPDSDEILMQEPTLAMFSLYRIGLGA